MFKDFATMRKLASERPQLRIAVAAAADAEVIAAVKAARAEGIAECILCGDCQALRQLLLAEDLDPSEFRLRQADTVQEAAQAAVAAVRQGEAVALMKGLLPTADLLRAVLDKEKGIRGSGLMSHVMLYELPHYPRLLLNTDGGMCTFPSLAEKITILENAATLLRQLGYSQITAAALCATEQVQPKIKATVEAAELAAMTTHWQQWQMQVLGPISLDLAISPEACAHKGYHLSGAGQADILLVPDYQVGNCLGKALSYFGGAENAGLVLGAQVPIILVSRADSYLAKLNAMALAVLSAAAP